MTEEQLLDAIFVKEGSVYAEPPAIDQPTGPGGITLPVLTEYNGHPCTVNDLRALTVPAAREIVRWDLRRLATHTGLDALEYEPVRLQMIDFAYNSGAPLAIRWLQRVLRVPRTSMMDAATVTAANEASGFLLNQALIAARLQMIDMATDGAHPAIDRTFEEGLESRALTFSLLTVP